MRRARRRLEAAYVVRPATRVSSGASRRAGAVLQHDHGRQVQRGVGQGRMPRASGPARAECSARRCSKRSGSGKATTSNDSSAPAARRSRSRSPGGSARRPRRRAGPGRRRPARARSRRAWPPRRPGGPAVARRRRRGPGRGSGRRAGGRPRRQRTVGAGQGDHGLLVVGRARRLRWPGSGTTAPRPGRSTGDRRLDAHATAQHLDHHRGVMAETRASSRPPRCRPLRTPGRGGQAGRRCPPSRSPQIRRTCADARAPATPGQRMSRVTRGLGGVKDDAAVDHTGP